MNKIWDEYVQAGASNFQEGKYSEAENYMHAALMESESLGDDLKIALSLDNLAEVFFEQGKYDKAEPLYQRSLSIRERVLEPEHEEIVASLNNLSTLYFFQEKYVEAEPLCRQLTTIYEKVLGHNHPQVATSLNNLGIVLKARKKYGAAEKIFKHALGIM